MGWQGPHLPFTIFLFIIYIIFFHFHATSQVLRLRHHLWSCLACIIKKQERIFKDWKEKKKGDGEEGRDGACTKSKFLVTSFSMKETITQCKNQVICFSWLVVNWDGATLELRCRVTQVVGDRAAVDQVVTGYAGT